MVSCLNGGEESKKKRNTKPFHKIYFWPHQLFYNYFLCWLCFNCMVACSLLLNVGLIIKAKHIIYHRKNFQIWRNKKETSFLFWLSAPWIVLLLAAQKLSITDISHLKANLQGLGIILLLSQGNCGHNMAYLWKVRNFQAKNFVLSAGKGNHSRYNAIKKGERRLIQALTDTHPIEKLSKTKFYVLPCVIGENNDSHTNFCFLLMSNT